MLCTMKYCGQMGFTLSLYYSEKKKKDEDKEVRGDL